MIEVTQEMIYAFNEGVLSKGRAIPVTLGDVRAGLEAALRVVNAGGIPDEVTEVTDSDGDTWRRVPDQPEVWEVVGYTTTAQHTGLDLTQIYGPLRWEDKS